MNVPKLLAAGFLAVTATCGFASAETMPQTRVYAFHSSAQGACPGLDWHVVATGNKLNGMISWGNGQHVAKVQGTTNPNGQTFEMQGVEVGGQQRTATINGSLTTDGWMVANINGPGVACKAVQVHWFTPETFGGD